jgi:hypothetical protein
MSKILERQENAKKFFRWSPLVTCPAGWQRLLQTLSHGRKQEKRTPKTGLQILLYRNVPKVQVTPDV